MLKNIFVVDFTTYSLNFIMEVSAINAYFQFYSLFWQLNQCKQSRRLFDGVLNSKVSLSRTALFVLLLQFTALIKQEKLTTVTS